MNNLLDGKLRFWILIGCCVSTSVFGQYCDSNIPATTPIDRFILSDNGTVFDQKTNLMWTRCPYGVRLSEKECIGSGFPYYSWERALETVKETSYAGYSNWRLPNIKELATLVEYQCVAPAINTKVFPGNYNHSSYTQIWSSSPSYYSGTDEISRSEAASFMLDFDAGKARLAIARYGHNIRMVRDVQTNVE